MDAGKSWFTYSVGGMIVIVFLVFLAIKFNGFSNEKDVERAVEHTRDYLEQNYPVWDYEILGVDSSTDFRHYGYFEHAVKVQNKETNEIFDVYYDKKMDRMEDSNKIEQIEQHLTLHVTPKVETYVAQHFGETRYIYVTYYMETGKPMIVVTFNENDPVITQAEFDAFVTYLKEDIGFEHANVIVDYWMKAVLFDLEY